jgi:hypothetical protein
VIGGVDAELLQRLDNLGVHLGSWLASGGAWLVAIACGLTEQALCHDAAAAVGDADEEDVHAASFSAWADRTSVADSARTYW